MLRALVRLAQFGLIAGFALALLTLPQVQKGLQTVWQQISPPAPGPLTVTRFQTPAAGLPQIRYDYEPKAEGLQRYEVIFDGKPRSFWMLSPQPAPAEGALPGAVLLLHGSNRSGASMLDMWRSIGAKGVVLIAPDSLDPMVWRMETDGAPFQQAVLAQAVTITPFDRDKVSLYGHSAGANGALELGQCTDLPVRAIAIHAGAFAGCKGWSTSSNRRYLIQIGDQDESFPLGVVEATAKMLADSGAAVDLAVIEGHNHWFYQIGPNLAQQAWQFFEE